MTFMADPRLRIASYNIRKARGLDNRRMPDRILDVINGLNADVVLLQEADKRLGRRPPAIPREMIAAQTDFDLVETSRNGLSLGWHGNAVLVRRGLQASEVTRVDLPGLEPRGAVRVTLNVGAGLCVVATHLGLRRRDRQRQLHALMTATAGWHHTVMAGDFNEWSRHRGFEPLAHRFQVMAPGRSFHARRPLAALDRFAISHGLTLVGGGVAEDDLARRASDHLPVWADIAVPQARAGRTGES